MRLALTPLIIGFVVLTAALSCSPQSQQSTEQNSIDTKLPNSSVEPQNPDTEKSPPIPWEIYINKYTNSPTNGCILRYVTGLRNLNGKASSSASCGDTGGPIYETKIEVPDDEENHYSITVTHPVGEGRASFTRDVIFTGEDIEFYRDSNWRIGMRAESQPQHSQPE
ncbi:MAG: hypothetical protein GXP30_10520 [Verrucomicrobia bacterium]|nr:hypothetical protein [Verrucomicrobiota bacterium]